MDNWLSIFDDGIAETAVTEQSNEATNHEWLSIFDDEIAETAVTKQSNEAAASHNFDSDEIAEAAVTDQSNKANAANELTIVASESNRQSAAEVATQAPVVARPQHVVQFCGGARRRRFRTGQARKYNSRGTSADRAAWNLDMQLRKMQKKVLRCESDAVSLLTSLRRRSSTSSFFKVCRGKGGLSNKSGLMKVIQCRLKTKGNRFGWKWAMEDFLHAAFGSDLAKGKRLQQRNAQALSGGMDGSTVAYMRAVVSGSVLSRQSHLLARLFLLCRENPPTVACVREAWDETGQSVVVQQERGVWQIIVVKRILVVAWEPAEGSADPTIARFPLVCPPMLVLSPSADRIHWALNNHPCLQTILKMESAILATASERVHLQETDAASANERLYHHRLNTLSSETLREVIFCHNHQNNLLEGSLVSVTHAKLISDFFSFTHFLQASSHFVKLKFAVRQFIEESAVITSTVGNPVATHASREYLREMCSMQLLVRAALTQAHSHGKPSESRFEAKLAQFKQMWNGDLTSVQMEHLGKLFGEGLCLACGH